MIETLTSLNRLEKAIALGICVALLLSLIAGLEVFLELSYLVSALSLLYFQQKRKKKRKEQEKKIIEFTYQEVLENLRQQPNNPQLKEAASKAGRAYYESLRGGKFTPYDEKLLANDLSKIVGTDTAEP